MKSPLPVSDNGPGRWLLLLLCGGLVSGWFGVSVQAADPPAKEADPKKAAAAESTEASPAEPEPEEQEELSNWVGGGEYSGWLELSVGQAWTKVNAPEFRQRHDISSGLTGGLTDFYWENFVGEKGIFKVRGRGIGGNEDYGFSIDYTETDKGFIRGGFTRNRTWSGNSGGFFPPTSLWQPLSDASPYLDRDKIWLEGGLTLPDWPAITLGYTRESRNGVKDSTIWGAASAPFTSRGVAASFLTLDEERDTFRVDISDTIGKTEAGIGMRYERSRMDNTLNFRRDANLPAQTFTTQHDGVGSDLFNFHSHSVTRLKDNLNFGTGYSFTQLDTDLFGSRIQGATVDSVFTPALALFPGFVDLSGGTLLNQHVFAVNLMWLPTTNISVVPSFRAESSGLNSSTFFTGTPGAGLAQQVGSEEDFLDFSERLEVRFTGVTNWVFYARGDWEQKDGDLQERQLALATGTLLIARDTDFKRFAQKYTTGANWYPRRRLNLAAQYYYRERDNDYTHLTDSTVNTGGNRYPAYLTSQDFDTHDVNFRITTHLFKQMVSVTRYDYQVSRVNTGGNNAAPIQSADFGSHIISQSLSWNPIDRLYLQGTFSYAVDTTDTPVTTTGPGAVVLKSKNNYWMAGLTAGYALGERTDLDVDYLYSRADNFLDNSTGSLGYGAGFTEHRVMTTLTRRISENLRVLLRYGYIRNDDETYGGNVDFTAHLVSTSLQYRF